MGTISPVQTSGEHMRIPIGLLMLAVPFLAMLVIVAIAYNKPVCMPTETSYDYWQGCIACKNYTLPDGKRWNNEGRLQTLSEMVARDDTTTEAFAAASAIAVIGIAFVVEQVTSTIAHRKALCKALSATVFVAACGMIGLTVWSMRVHGLLHSTFTALTILVLLEQLFICFVAFRITEPPLIKSWWGVALAALVPSAALCVYVVKYAHSKSIQWPGPSGVKCDEYFDLSNYEHAIAQCIFVVVYFVEMAYVSYMAETRIENTKAVPVQAVGPARLTLADTREDSALLRRHRSTVVQF